MTSLILHARCAGIVSRNMPHLENRLRWQPGSCTSTFTPDRLQLLPDFKGALPLPLRRELMGGC
jgi:hypothetical protein